MNVENKSVPFLLEELFYIFEDSHCLPQFLFLRISTPFVRLSHEVYASLMWVLPSGHPSRLLASRAGHSETPDTHQGCLQGAGERSHQGPEASGMATQPAFSNIGGLGSSGSAHSCCFRGKLPCIMPAAISHGNIFQKPKTACGWEIWATCFILSERNGVGPSNTWESVCWLDLSLVEHIMLLPHPAPQMYFLQLSCW